MCKALWSNVRDSTNKHSHETVSVTRHNPSLDTPNDDHVPPPEPHEADDHVPPQEPREVDDEPPRTLDDPHLSDTLGNEKDHLNC